MNISGQLRAKRNEMYEADRRGALKDRQAIAMSVEVAKLKRLSDKLRLSVCEQLRLFIEVIHGHLAASPDEVAGTERSKFSAELADKCVELLHCVTITAMKKEIFEAKRLLRNLHLHNGRSSVFVLQTRRLDFMDAELQQRLQKHERGDGFDPAREKLLRVIEFHEVVGNEMRKLGPGRSQAEKVEASQRLMSCLRLIAEETANRELDDTPATADGALLDRECEDELAVAPAVGEAVENAFDISKRSLVLFDNMMVLYLDMKAQRDAMTIAAFAMLALAVYAFWC
ncbi:hypothetical protein PF005_g15858 [Phytophthora fragariae]|uniref:Uncharacterized protein n=1 Tax=Phytophthora fragariae TaxID=53985 RepID=A0A6A3XA75_9STRA|nr:hypothetical protein PF005_g15858 [Phytophthora fragariae]